MTSRVMRVGEGRCCVLARTRAREEVAEAAVEAMKKRVAPQARRYRTVAQGGALAPAKEEGGFVFGYGTGRKPVALPPSARTFDPLRATLDDVTVLARTYTVESIETMAKIMREATSDRVRLAAAEALLTRAWGKPLESVVIEQRVRSSGSSAPPLPPGEFADLLTEAAEHYRRAAARDAEFTVE